MNKNILLSFLCILFSLNGIFLHKGFCQISLDSSYFPKAGINFVRFVCSKGNVGNPGPSQTYSFTNSQVWSNDSLKYLYPTNTGYSSFHPGAITATADWDDISLLLFYSADANAFWTSGATLIGDFGEGKKTIHANYPAPYVDTLISDEYAYGHTETEISAIRFPNLVSGVDYQTVSGKYIQADGWGSLLTPFDTFPSVLRVKYIEYKFDTVFAFDTASASYVPIDATTDTLYYYKFFAQGKRHPVVTSHTTSTDSILWNEILYFPPVIYGCTDDSAENFNPLASADNGSCIYCSGVNYSISNDTSICEGDAVTLTASGATDYLWSTGATASSVTISPDSTTTLSVYLSNASYCWDMASVEIQVAEDVVAGFWANYRSPDDSVLFVNTSVNASDFFWDFGNSATSADKNPKHLFGSSGSKTVMLVASNECSSDTFFLTFTFSNYPELPESFIKLDLYPNPNKGKFNMVLDGSMLIRPGEMRFSIFNLLGENIYAERMDRKDISAIDVSHLPAGLYFLQVMLIDKTGKILVSEREKIIIQ